MVPPPKQLRSDLIWAQRSLCQCGNNKCFCGLPDFSAMRNAAPKSKSHHGLKQPAAGPHLLQHLGSTGQVKTSERTHRFGMQVQSPSGTFPAPPKVSQKSKPSGESQPVANSRQNFCSSLWAWTPPPSVICSACASSTHCFR